MKDLGNLNYFLGLEVNSHPKCLFLHQHKYTNDLISLAGLQSAAPVDTPHEVNVKFLRDEGDILPNPLLYRQLVGSLNYLTITRPDISFAVQQVSQFMHTPCHLHLDVVRRIIHYLKGTSHRELFFPTGTSLNLVVIVMLIGQVGACFLVLHLFLGKAKSKPGSLSLPLSLNIVLCL